MYKDRNKEQDFKLMHCYMKLENVEKWRQTRRHLKKLVAAKGANGGVAGADEPAPGASAGRPIGNKKAKVATAAAASSEKMQSSIEKMVAQQASSSEQRRLEAQERWAAIMQKTDIKIELETKRMAVKKRKEDFALLTADTSNMDPVVRAAHLMMRNAILAEMGLDQATGSATATPTTTPTPPEGAGSTTPPEETTATRTPPASEEPLATTEDPSSTSA